VLFVHCNKSNEVCVFHCQNQINTKRGSQKPMRLDCQPADQRILNLLVRQWWSSSAISIAIIL